MKLGPRSWVAFVLSYLAVVAGYAWAVKNSGDWKLFGVFVLAILLVQIIVTGRSVLEDVIEGLNIWKGTTRDGKGQ